MLKGQLALTAVRPTPPMVGTPPPAGGNLAAGRPTSASSQGGGFPASNAVDSNAGSYWESGGGAFPHWWQVDLGASHQVNNSCCGCPPAGARAPRRITVQGSVDGSSFATIAGASAFAFDPATGNTVTRTLPTTTARYVRLSISGNTGWPAAQLAQVEVYAGSTDPDNPPTTPSGLTVTGKTSTSVSLAWTASTDDTGVTGYQVRQGGTVVATVTGTTATVSGLSPSTAYTFTVAARDAAGNTSSASSRGHRHHGRPGQRGPRPGSTHLGEQPRPESTGRATWSTVTRTATGRAPTARSRSGCRSTWVARARSGGWC